MSNDFLHTAASSLFAHLERLGALKCPADSEAMRILLRAAEKHMRADFAEVHGGERLYATKEHPLGLREKADQLEAIRRDFRRGAHVELLVRRYGLSARHIRRIVQIEREEPGPAESTAQASVPQPAAADCLTDGRASGEATRSPKARQPRAQGVPTST